MPLVPSLFIVLELGFGNHIASVLRSLCPSTYDLLRSWLKITGGKSLFFSGQAVAIYGFVDRLIMHF